MVFQESALTPDFPDPRRAVVDHYTIITANLPLGILVWQKDMLVCSRYHDLCADVVSDMVASTLRPTKMSRSPQSYLRVEANAELSSSDLIDDLPSHTMPTIYTL